MTLTLTVSLLQTNSHIVEICTRWRKKMFSWMKPLGNLSKYQSFFQMQKNSLTLQKVVGADMLDEKKRFWLKKHMTSLRKTIKTRGKGLKRLRINK